MADYQWLDETHPIYDACVDLWKKNERRLGGGEDVLGELRRFDWETDEWKPTPEGAGWDNTHYSRRKNEAVYINFPDLFARTLIGHLMKSHPEEDVGLDFGTLGRVQRDEGTAAPSQAELVYYDVDGVGNEASQWDNFWATVAQNAIATGHRWIMCEGAPGGAPETRADEEQGLRPYLVEYSPLMVPNWFYDRRGRLQFAVINVASRDPRIVEGRFEGNDYEDGKLLLVAAGFASLGEEFAGGGWWLFDGDHEIVDRGNPGWTSTGGQIPLWPHFYERAKSTADGPRMSRPGTSELGQAAVAYMNLSSAADYDVWEAAQSISYLLGVDENSWKLAVEKLTSGSKWVPLPASQKTGAAPTVHDSEAGSVAGQNFETRLERKLTEAERLAALEASGTPESSGESKKAGFADIRAPRLALMASEMEQSQNVAIHYLEQRWGNANPSGSIEWPRKFELLPLVESLTELFELQSLADTRSGRLSVEAVMLAAKQKGIIANDDMEAEVRAELEDAVAQAESQRTQSIASVGAEEDADAILAAARAANQAEGLQAI